MRVFHLMLMGDGGWRSMEEIESFGVLDRVKRRKAVQPTPSNEMRSWNKDLPNSARLLDASPHILHHPSSDFGEESALWLASSLSAFPLPCEDESTSSSCNPPTFQVRRSSRPPAGTTEPSQLSKESSQEVKIS